MPAQPAEREADEREEDERERLEEQLQEAHRRHLASEPEQLYSPARAMYPPSEAGAERDQFGIAAASVSGWTIGVGDVAVPFARQSISKVLVHGLALADHGRAEVLRRVGVEPSGDAFNSLVFDERNKRPFNPMVNTGAIATTDLIRENSAEDRFERIGLGCARSCRTGSAGTSSTTEPRRADVETADLRSGLSQNEPGIRRRKAPSRPVTGTWS